MHELGIVFEIIKIVDRFVAENELSQVEKIVLEVGQLSSAVPKFLEYCFPAAVNDTPYAHTKLEIIIVPAMAACNSCHEQFNLVEHRRICPNCHFEHSTLLTGREFNIKEIVAC